MFYAEWKSTSAFWSCGTNRHVIFFEWLLLVFCLCFVKTRFCGPVSFHISTQKCQSVLLQKRFSWICMINIKTLVGVKQFKIERDGQNIKQVIVKWISENQWMLVINSFVGLHIGISYKKKKIPQLFNLKTPFWFYFRTPLFCTEYHLNYTLILTGQGCRSFSPFSNFSISGNFVAPSASAIRIFSPRELNTPCMSKFQWKESCLKSKVNSVTQQFVLLYLKYSRKKY